MPVGDRDTAGLPTANAQRSKTGGRVSRRLLDARQTILNDLPDRTDFLHNVMCQVGMPRRMTEG